MPTYNGVYKSIRKVKCHGGCGGHILKGEPFLHFQAFRAAQNICKGCVESILMSMVEMEKK